MAAREDVGRHNALDKLVGALVSASISGAAGAIILTSRVSVEMVQKATVIGSSLMVAISAPTALAIRSAEACGITLIGIARGSAFEIFSHPDRFSEVAFNFGDSVTATSGDIFVSAMPRLVVLGGLTYRFPTAIASAAPALVTK